MKKTTIKLVLRTEIPELKGYSPNDAYPFFKERLGPADEIDGDEKEIWRFLYQK